jgi:hypothetical protein
LERYGAMPIGLRKIWAKLDRAIGEDAFLLECADLTTKCDRLMPELNIETVI